MTIGAPEAAASTALVQSTPVDEPTAAATVCISCKRLTLTAFAVESTEKLTVEPSSQDVPSFARTVLYAASWSEPAPSAFRRLEASGTAASDAVAGAAGGDELVEQAVRRRDAVTMRMVTAVRVVVSRMI
ncbi:hypothetical protein QN355_09005 [Cryobacterium sp. 10S3]|uniref:hypothetical protein n=1 Tax=unclassified Cryobacterium TaxID=2649013 RepID=UPI002AC9974F|nr:MULTISPECIES: hypothetical protein [unclassified Cryobacterium]MEB0001656.1 hypothetical protein [Cryobacterium sp. RTC2.1]MEB0286687.1 hypothetical protein [Cryobacterium sp. 10S3]WPX13192.1 hypothetical protein RHM57_16205 [Cryobacterium sp. 10S3]